MSPELGQPWQAFLDDIDALLTEPVTLHCLLTGFMAVAGKISPLHKKQGLYPDVVTVTEYSDASEHPGEQLPGVSRNLRVTLEPTCAPARLLEDMLSMLEGRGSSAVGLSGAVEEHPGTCEPLSGLLQGRLRVDGVAFEALHARRGIHAFAGGIGR